VDERKIAGVWDAAKKGGFGKFQGGLYPNPSVIFRG
jgi:c-di-GMP-related signal transduction protein